MIVETFWNSTLEFFSLKNMNSVFWAIILASFIERFYREFNMKEKNPIKFTNTNQYIRRLFNFLAKMVICFFAGVIFLLLIFGILAIISFIIEFIWNKVV